MGRILVTGAAGFIGGHCCKALLQQGWQVSGLDNFDPFYARAVKEQALNDLRSHPGFEFVEGDIRDGELAERLARGSELVLHLAARAGVRPSIEEPEAYASVNLTGTISLLEACRRAGVRRFIFGSSSSVYGDLTPVPFREDAPAVDPISPYAATKRAGELVCRVYSHLHGFRVAALRFFTVYGPRQRPDLAIHRFTRLLVAGQPIQQFGDGSTERDYTHVDDIVAGVLGAVRWTESEEAAFEIFNLGESSTVRLDRLIALISGALGVTPAIERRPMVPGDVQRTFADVSKARTVLGYNPQVSIEERRDAFRGVVPTESCLTAGMRLRILHVLSPQAAGGLERVVELLAGGMAERGHAVAAVVLLDPTGAAPPIVEALEASGVAVTTVRAPARFYWREARAVSDAARSFQADIVHAHGYRADVVSVMAGRGRTQRLVSTVHGFVGGDPKNRLYEWLDRLVLRRFDAVIAVTASLHERMVRSGVSARRISLIENGVGPDRALERDAARASLGLPRDRPCVGWIGRMSIEKGADLLVESLRPLATGGTEIVLIGDGPERNELERSAGPGFRFMGRVDDAGKYVAAFDVLVLSSRTEGTPMVLLEAMQAGVPVAAFGVGGVPSVLEGEVGWLVSPGDVEGLRESVQAILANPAEARRRADRGRARAQERFSLDAWLDRVESVYRVALTPEERR